MDPTPDRRGDTYWRCGTTPGERRFYKDRPGAEFPQPVRRPERLRRMGAERRIPSA